MSLEMTAIEAATVVVDVHGRYLRRGEERFLVRGVVYQRNQESGTRRPLDPIADDELPRLRHDVELFKTLGVNTIFVYFLDNTKPRGQAMKLLEQAGIYVLFTISTPLITIKRSDPHGSYNSDTLAHFFRTVDAMSAYRNSLGAFVQYDLINNRSSLECAPVVAAVVRDVKRYMDMKQQTIGRRILPIGYGGSSVTEGINEAVMVYLSSQESASRIDFWSCKFFPSPGDGTTEPGIFNDLIERHQNLKIPTIISEFHPRSYEDGKALFSPSVARIFSGGCFYDMWDGGNQYGLVQMVTPARGEIAGGPVRERRETEFGTLVVYEDFFDYKAALGETKEAGRSLVEEEPVPGELTQPFEIPGEVPESCVDWSAS